MKLSPKDQLVNLVFFHKLYLRVKLGQDVSFDSERSPYELAIFYPEKGTVRADGSEPVTASENKAKKLLQGDKFIINPDKTISFVANDYTPLPDCSPAACSFKNLTRFVFIQELVKWSQKLAQGSGLLLSTLRESVPADITVPNGSKISLSSRTHLGFFPMEDLSDIEYKKLLAATQFDKQYEPKKAAKKIQQLFETFSFIKINSSSSPLALASIDARVTPGLSNFYNNVATPSGCYSGMLTDNDFKEILGDLMVTTGDIKSKGAYIIPVTAKDEKAIYEKIDDIIKVYQATSITGEITVHIPLSTGFHYTLLSLKINRDDKDNPEITEIELSDSIGSRSTQISKLDEGNYKNFFSGILRLCPVNLFAADCKFVTVNRNAQSGNLFCGDYTIQEVLRKIGKKVGAIAFDQSQDLEKGHKLRGATIALVRARIAKKPHAAQDLSPAELEVVAKVQASFKVDTTAKINSGHRVVVKKSQQKSVAAKIADPKPTPQRIEQKGIVSAIKSLLLLPFVIVDFVGDSLRSAGTKLLKGIGSAINLPFVIVNFVGDALKAAGTKLHKAIVPAKIDQQKKSSPRTPKILPPLSAKSTASSTVKRSSSVVKPVLALAPAVKTAKISAVSSKAGCTDKQGTQMSKTAPAY